MSSDVVSSPDVGLLQVREFLVAKGDLLKIVGEGVRKAFDEVIDGPRTGRYCLDQLEKTEKTYIGTKVEIVLRAELGLERGLDLDNSIAGHEVDTKFTVGKTWTIPIEAVGKLCLLVYGWDDKSECGLGLLRITDDVLNPGKNRDGKRGVSAAGKEKIDWLAKGPMPKNFMLDLPEELRNLIMSAPTGRGAIRALFENVTGKIIPRKVVEQVARQKDPMKRAREVKAILAAEGLRVLCATYKADREEFVRNGFTAFQRDDWLSIRVTKP